MDTERIKKARKQSDGNTLVILGVILGVAIGGVVALVYSKGSGKQNRKELNQWAHRRLDVVQRKIEGVVKRDG